MLTLKNITRYEDFVDLKEQWNKLLEGSVSNCIFLSWEWAKTWWDEFGSDKELLIILGYDAGELIGIAPLMFTKAELFGMKLRSVEFIGSGMESMPDHLHFIVSKECLSGFAKMIFEYIHGIDNTWDIIRLRDMSEDPDMLGYIKHTLKDSFVYSVVSNKWDICPYLTLPDSWEKLLSGLSKSWRYKNRSCERRMLKDYPVKFEIITDQNELSSAMEVLERLHRARVKEKKLTGPSLNANFWRFHEKLAPLLLAQRKLFMGILKISEEIIACDYAFIHNNSVSYYQCGIDPVYGKYSVGCILTARLIQESIRMGVSEFDFLRGDEPYKLRWTKNIRKSVAIIVWNPKLHFGITPYLYNVKTFIKNYF